jgi:beta-glucosidase
VTNTGERASREVVQVYFEPTDPDQPIRLVGWRAVEAGPGESVTAEVTTDSRMWRRWDDTANAWTRLTGAGQLLVARGLGDVRASVKLEPGA